MRRLAPAIMFLGCAGGLVYSFTSFRAPEPPPAKVQKVAVAPPVRQMQTVQGQVSVDKIALMSDPEMVALLAANGLIVKAGTAPAREMIQPPAPETQYVFSWPTDDETAAQIAYRLPHNPWVKGMPAPFYTSPVILAWAPAADALARAGMVRGSGRWRTLDLSSLVAAASASKRWSDVAPKGTWTSDRPLQVRMPDLRRSGTTTMFLAVVAQTANEGREVVTSDRATEIAARIAPMFQQGRQPATSRDAIAEFMSFGISRTPMLLVSEADAIQLLSRPGTSRDIVVLYPDETVVAPQVFVPYTLMGQRVGRVLERPEVRSIALRHGFRVAGSPQVPGRWSSPSDSPPATFQTILEMPDPAIVETIISQISMPPVQAPPPAATPERVEPREQQAAPEPVQPPQQAPIRDPGEEAPPVRPVIDPDASAEYQQRRVQDYIRQLEAYRARQAARAAAAEGNQR